jgi:hypothetical protein
MSPLRISKPILLTAACLILALPLGCSWITLGNHPPVIAKDAIITTTTESNMLQEITGVTTKITVHVSDPDGDVLTFHWTSSNGTITGNGPSGTWRREMKNNNNELVSGTATVTVSDGHGGEATYTYNG